MVVQADLELHRAELAEELADGAAEAKKVLIHYIKYFPFVSFFASVVAFTAFHSIGGTDSGAGAYAAAIAAGLGTGFAGDRLAGILRTGPPLEKK